MGRRNSFLKDFILPTAGIMVFLFVLPDIIISSVPKELGKVERRRHQLQSAVKSLTFQRQVEQSKCGETVYKLVPSCSLTNVLKRLDD